MYHQLLLHFLFGRWMGVWCRQVALADLVMVNKVDLVCEEELRAVSERVRCVLTTSVESSNQK